MTTLERLACWYLERRGLVVLDRNFVGIAIGNCTLTQHDGITWAVAPGVNPPRIIALNHSVVCPLNSSTS